MGKTVKKKMLPFSQLPLNNRPSAHAHRHTPWRCHKRKLVHIQTNVVVLQYSAHKTEIYSWQEAQLILGNCMGNWTVVRKKATEIHVGGRHKNQASIWQTVRSALQTTRTVRKICNDRHNKLLFFFLSQKSHEEVGWTKINKSITKLETLNCLMNE